MQSLRTDPQRASRSVTLLEVLVVAVILALLSGLFLSSLRAARARAMLDVCAARLGVVAKGLMQYATTNRDTFPVASRWWTDADAGSAWVYIGQMHNWVQSLSEEWYGAGGGDALLKLRCPASVVAREPWMGDLGFRIVEEGELGSCWYLNAYCSGRQLSSIPRPSDGVLLLEIGVWDGRAVDTGSLAHPTEPYAYPHPRALVELARVAWQWNGTEPQRHQRNVAWTDGHVSRTRALRWPTGDQPWDADRLRHMAFSLQPAAPLP